MKKYLVNIHQSYDIEVDAENKDEAEQKALVGFENNPSKSYNGNVVAGSEEVQEELTEETFSDYESKVLEQFIADEEKYAQELDDPEFTEAIKNIKQKLLG